MTDLEPGLYHYCARTMPWLTSAKALLLSRSSASVAGNRRRSQSAAVIFLAGMVQRTIRKYGDRGLRYVFLDAGHLAQNMCLTATAAGLGCMTTCGFYDDEANDLFGLDGVAESMLYVGFVGRQAPSGGCPEKGTASRQD